MIDFPSCPRPHEPWTQSLATPLHVRIAACQTPAVMAALRRQFATAADAREFIRVEQIRMAGLVRVWMTWAEQSAYERALAKWMGRHAGRMSERHNRERSVSE
jgi:hypothetical protein